MPNQRASNKPSASMHRLPRFGMMAAVLTVTALCASCGPRMREQISIQPYRQAMPTAPRGAVPIQGRLESLAAKRPVSSRQRPELLDDGRIFYGYYCKMCHGAKGDGNGPVGESFVPKPADLTSPTIRGLTDDALYRRMLHGVGHDPVMSQTVLLEHRRPIVLYVRSLSGRKP